MKLLVVYYSLDGNTKAAAERIAGDLGCDVCAVEPEKPIPDKGFKKMFVGGRQATFGEKPAIKKPKYDPAGYDIILIGTPIWAGKCSSPMWSFINSCPVRQRIRGLFTLSGGGDNMKCIKQVEKVTGELYVALALNDKNSPKSSRNEEKIPLFIEAVHTLIKHEESKKQANSV